MPFEVPKSWEWVKLSEIASFGGGKTPSMAKKAYWQNGNNLWVTSKDMKSARIGDSKLKISDEALSIMTVYEPGTLLLVTRSGILRHSMPLAILEKRATVNQDIKTISLFVSELNEFVYYSIKARESFILKDYHKDGTTVDSIDFDKFSNILLPIPPLNEQIRIVRMIGRLFSSIDEIDTNKQDLLGFVDQAKSKVLDLAIHGKLVPQDPSDEPAIELLKRINPSFVSCDTSHYENTPFEVPQNWVWVRIKDIAISELGKTLDRGKNSGKPYDYLCALNVKWNAFDLTTVKQILLEDNERERYLVRRGDLLICEGGDVGRAAIWENDEEIYYQNALHRVRFKGNINQYFYLYVLQYYKIIGLIDDVSGGVTIKHFTQNSMKKLLFPLPPLEEQKRIVSKVSKLLNLLDKITAEL